MYQAEIMTGARFSPRAALLRACLPIVVCALLCGPLHADTRPDAIIELWDQHWSLSDDGTIVYHHRQHVQLNNERAYGEFADPRITFRNGDKLEILTARVRRPDGSYRELPDYSHVLVTPDATAGWPVLADIRQHLLVMSGIEPGCVVELEYRLTSPPGSRPDFAADVRLDHRYPIKQRSVALTAPASIRVEPVFTGKLPGSAAPRPVVDGNTRIWRFENLAPAPQEPQTPPWQSISPRFAFSAATSAPDWLRSTVEQMETAADRSDLITELATRWTQEEVDPSDKLRAIQQKLSATFNFVTCDPDWWPRNLRPASRTLSENHGTPQEAATALIALARAAGLSVQPAVVVNDDVWLENAPQRATTAAYAVLLDLDDQLQPWEPQFGRITRDRRWAGHTLMILQAGQPLRLSFAPWTDPDESRCILDLSILLNPDATYTGQGLIRLTGLFVDPENLRGTDAQKTRLKSLLSHLLPEADIESFSVSKLSDEEFAVALKIKSSTPLKELHGRRWFQLTEDPPFMASVTVPLGAAARDNPVRLAGAFQEVLSLTIHLPESWTIEVQPTELAAAGAWGSASQRAARHDDNLTIDRQVRVDSRDLPPNIFLEFRSVLNQLRGPAARTAVFKP
jgi:hypothetical protein